MPEFPPLVEFEYRRLGDFTYNIVSDPIKLDRFLKFWLQNE